MALFCGSARQFVFRYGVLVRFAGRYEEFAPASLADFAGNRALEMTMTQPVEDDLTNPVQRLPELRSAGR